MRAVNLLPEKHRPRRPSGGKGGSAYILLGVLGALVVAVLMYVMTVNSINEAKTDIAEAEAATQQANAQADQLGPYGDFAKIKQQRVDSVKQLAAGRVDWERMVRELAHVLPNGVWIQNASASDSGSTSSGTGDSPSEDASAGGAGPTLTLQGCAPDPSVVAETLVRLRQLQGATDVTLDRTATKEEDGASATASTGVATDCGESGGKPNYDFQADVTFEAPAPGADEDTVPARLGGGQ